MTGDRNPRRLCVEVVYALREEQLLVALEVEEGTSVREAIERSGILARVPGMDFPEGRLGVFGKAARPDTILRDGDRVEIYRPLAIDPREGRRRKARSRR